MQDGLHCIIICFTYEVNVDFERHILNSNSSNEDTPLPERCVWLGDITVRFGSFSHHSHDQNWALPFNSCFDSLNDSLSSALKLAREDLIKIANASLASGMQPVDSDIRWMLRARKRDYAFRLTIKRHKAFAFCHKTSPLSSIHVLPTPHQSFGTIFSTVLDLNLSSESWVVH
jgi:hypothetical protein